MNNLIKSLVIRRFDQLTSKNWYVNAVNPHTNKEHALQIELETTVFFDYNERMHLFSFVLNPEQHQFFNDLHDEILQRTKLPDLKYLKVLKDQIDGHDINMLMVKVKKSVCLNAKDEIIPTTSVRRMDKVKATIECNGIWCLPRGNFLSWNLLRLKVLE